MYFLAGKQNDSYEWLQIWYLLSFQNKKEVFLFGATQCLHFCCCNSWRPQVGDIVLGILYVIDAPES